MKTNAFLALVATTAIALTAGAALARDGGPRLPIEFGTLDTNGDGQITLEEMQARGSARFAEADADGDGFLTLEEVQAAASARVGDRSARMFERMDANADGRLSPDELQRPDRAERRFSQLDTDGDGAVTEAEFEAARDKVRGARKDRGGSD